MALWLLLFAFIISLIVTALIRRYALAKNIIDVPNSRSSHSIPTPRGGGVAIVLTFLLGFPVLAFYDLVSTTYALALTVAAGGVALLGFLDDHGHVAARWRLLGHFSAAAICVFILGGLPPLFFFGIQINFGLIGAFAAVLYLVWMLNLYNFMDGIDGLASVEAVSASCSAAIIYWLLGYHDLIWLPLLLSVTVLGFLYWNFPPARIFMGDAGSGFLGLVLGFFSLMSAWANSMFLWVWLILLGVFIVDATLTLVTRFLRGEKVYEAHRSHAYQFAARSFRSHRVVTLSVLCINVCWLFPLAICVALFGLDGLTGLIIAYAPLFFIAFKFGAGQLELKH